MHTKQLIIRSIILVVIFLTYLGLIFPSAVAIVDKDGDDGVWVDHFDDTSGVNLTNCIVDNGTVILSKTTNEVTHDFTDTVAHRAYSYVTPYFWRFYPPKIHIIREHRLLEWTEEIGMKRYKIASRSIYNKELAEAIAATGKPVIISYGMVEAGRVPAIVEILGMDERLKHLYCISKYPTPFSDIHFFTSEGQPIFGPHGYDGFSDHSIGTIAPIVAMYFGATIIEKHFTLNRSSPGPDHICSITPRELQRLCEARNEIEQLLYGIRHSTGEIL